MMSRCILAASALSVLTACSTADESTVDPFDPTVLPQIQLTELVELGRDINGSEPVLNRVTGAIILSNEEIALASDHGEILVFGVSGDFRRRLGRQGEGPGEFRFIDGIVRLDDNRILAWDPALDRLTVFGRDGILEKTITPTWALSKQAGVGFVGAFGDGSFVLEDRSRGEPAEDAPDGFGQDTIPYLLFDPSGVLVRTIGHFVPRAREYTAEGGFQRYLFDTSVLSRIVGDELLVGENESIVLVRFDSSGTARPRLSLERGPEGVTELDIEAGWRVWEEQMVVQQEQMMDQMAASFGGSAAAAMQQRADEALARAREAIQPPEFLPAYKSIVVGSDGALWVEDYLHPTEEISRWILMGAGFSPVGWIELQPKERLLAAGPNSLIVLRKDDLDVESVVIFHGDWPVVGSLDGV
jgi:hypothetical protein